MKSYEIPVKEFLFEEPAEILDLFQADNGIGASKRVIIQLSYSYKFVLIAWTRM